MDSFDRFTFLIVVFGEFFLVLILLFGFVSHRREIEELKVKLKEIQKVVECKCCCGGKGEIEK